MKIWMKVMMMWMKSCRFVSALFFCTHICVSVMFIIISITLLFTIGKKASWEIKFCSKKNIALEETVLSHLEILKERLDKKKKPVRTNLG